MPPPDESMASSTFRLHPDFLINFFRHQTRAKDQAARPFPPADAPTVFGCVVGTQRGQTVEIFDCLDLPASAARRHAFLEKRRKKELSPDLDIIGWYSTGTGRDDTDTQEIHKALMMGDANGTTTRRDFYLLVVDHDATDDHSSETNLRVTVYDCVLHAARPIFVKSDCDLEFLDLDRISTDLHKGCFLCRPNRSADDSGEKEDEGGTGTRGIRRSVWMILLETPSGFAMFSVDARFLQYPYEIWLWFTRLSDACAAVSTLGFIKLADKKSLAWDARAGPSEDLAKFILRFMATHTQALIVPDTQLKYVIERKLNVSCCCYAHIVHELTWGLNYVLDEFVPEERDNLITDECHLPLSKELDKKIRAYGFNVSPRVFDREFISTVGHLYSQEYISKSFSVYLRRIFGHCFPRSHRMSDLEFAKAVADSLHSSEEMMIPKDDRYSKQEILKFTDSILAAPESITHDISVLKRMEEAASEDPLGVLDKKNPCLERMEPVASENCFAVSEAKGSVEFWDKAEAKGKEPKLQVKTEVATSKPKVVGKNKKGDDNDNEDDTVDGIDSDSSDDEEEEERPKKPENRKKRATRSVLKMPASNKKAKVTTQHRVARIRQAKRTRKYGLQDESKGEPVLD